METDKPIRPAATRTISDDVLRRDLEKFRLKAIELGASDAAVIPAADVIVDERVWMKCLVPRCANLHDGGTPYCPPHTPQPEFTRQVFSKYRWAVLFKRDILDLEEHIPTTKEQRREMWADIEKRGSFHTRTYEIVGGLESYAQSEGYYLAMGFSAGSCRTSLCKGATCAVIEKGSCRWPLRSRPSMEGVGIDVFALAKKVGWESYMIRNLEPDLSVIPHGFSMGIVFIY